MQWRSSGFIEYWLTVYWLYFHCSVENRFITGGNYRVLSSSRRRLRPSSKLENRPRKLKVQTTQETLCSLKRLYMCVIACLSFRGTKESQTELPGVAEKGSHCQAASNGEEALARKFDKRVLVRFTLTSCVFRKQSRLDRKERELPAMLLKIVLKTRRLKARRQWLISPQNLRRKNRSRKWFKSLKFLKSFNLMTTASQISKCSTVRDMPRFCHLFFLLLSSVYCLHLLVF